MKPNCHPLVFFGHSSVCLCNVLAYLHFHQCSKNLQAVTGQVLFDRRSCFSGRLVLGQQSTSVIGEGRLYGGFKGKSRAAALSSNADSLLLADVRKSLA
jgi:hypothetical protein